MSIQMPNREEKAGSIRLILDRGIPQKEQLPARISSLVGSIGLRNLFWDTWDCVFLALIAGITLAGLFLLSSALYQKLLPAGLFLLSPAVYGLLHFFTMWKERQTGLYEIKMTCHYTLRELTALRMVFFGGASALLDVLFVLCLGRQPEMVLTLFQMLGISLSALFLYGAATLFALSRTGNRNQWLVPAAWCTLCVAPFFSHADVLGALMKIPGAVALTAALLCLVLFFAELEHYLSEANQGGAHHAVS